MTIDQFGKALVASGLMTADDVKATWNGISADARPKDGAAFGKLLVEKSLLTPFQVAELLAGRGARLMMGDYTIVAQIGAGGMGQVYKAQHRRMKRVVALKVMSNAAMQDEAAVKRFQREVHAAARLEHPNIVTAYDSGEAGSVKYLVMQFVDGGDLSDLVKKSGRLDIAQAVGYVIQAARGLAFAHGEGVIHRDIKPANLLLDKKGIVKILDMGLARFEDGGDGLTATEQVMGTVDYMSPEQAANTKGCDGRADIYSLGCTLWYLLTGKKLYEADTLIARLMLHRDGPLPSLVKERDDAPWPLEQALHKMIAKRAADRYQSMDEAIAALAPFGGASAGGSSPSMGQSAELASFMQAMGTGGGTKTNVSATQVRPSTSANVDATAQFTSAEVGTDPKSQVLPKAATTKPQTQTKKSKAGNNKTKMIAGGIGGLALLISLGVWIVVRDKDGNDVAKVQVPEGGAALIATSSPPSQDVQPKPSGRLAGSSDGYDSKIAGAKPVRTDGSMITAADEPTNSAIDFSGINGPYFSERIFDTNRPFTMECTATPLSLPVEGDQWNSPVMSMSWVQVKLYSRLSQNRHSYSCVLHHADGTLTTIDLGPAIVGKPTRFAMSSDGREVFCFDDGKLVRRERIKSPLKNTAGCGVARYNAGYAQGGWTSFPGTVDEVRFSTVARYTADYVPPTRFATDADTALLLHFDEGFGETVRDGSEKGSVATIAGAKWVRGGGRTTPADTSTAPSRNALKLNGNSYVDIGSDWIYDGGDLTFEAWLISDAPRSTNTFLAVDHDADGRRHAVRLSRRPDGIIEVARPSEQLILRFDDPLPSGRPAHFAVVWQGPEIRAYVDGKQVAPQPHQFPFAPRPGKPYAWMGGLPADASLTKAQQLCEAIFLESRISSRARYDADFSPPARLTSDQNTVSHFKFDEGAGDVLHDSSGRHRHAKIAGPQWVQVESGPIAAPTMTDLFRNLDIVANALAGQFALDGQGLRVTDGAQQARITLPVDPMPAEYDLHVDVGRLAPGGKAFVVGVPWQGSQGCVVVDGFSNPPLSGLELVDGQTPKVNGTENPGEKITFGPRNHKLIVRVRNDGIAAECDGKPLFDWKGKPSQLSTHAMWAVSRKDLPFLGFQGPYVVHGVELLPFVTKPVEPSVSTPAIAPAVGDQATVATWLLDNKKLARIGFEVGGRVQYMSTFPAGPYKVVELSFSKNNNAGQRLTEEELGRLAVFTDLETLEVGDQPLTDAGLVRLTTLKKLRKLTVPNTALTPAAVTTIRQFPQLETLHSFSTDEWLKPLAGMPSIKFLTIHRSVISTEAMSWFPQYPNLNELVLQDCFTAVGPELNAALAPLKDCKNLSKLRLSTGSVDAGTVAVLSGLTQLRDLDLGTTQFTEAQVKQLAATLPRCKITWTDAANKKLTFEPTAPAAAK